MGRYGLRYTPMPQGTTTNTKTAWLYGLQQNDENRTKVALTSMEVTAMKKPVKRLLFWTPRILCIVFAVFVSLFALDVFGEDHGFWKTLLALLMHLVPTGIILIVLAISWRWEWVGGIVFNVLGVLYLVMLRGRFHWSVYLVMSGPLFLIGVLFWLNWLRRGELRTTEPFTMK